MKWSELPPVPHPNGMSGLFAGKQNNYLILYGGTFFLGKSVFEGGIKTINDRAFVMDLQDNFWLDPQIIESPPLYDGISISTPEGLICIGGVDSAMQVNSSVFRLSVMDGAVSVTSLPSLPEPLTRGCGSLVNNKIYVTGGIQSMDQKFPKPQFWSLDLDHPEASWEVLEDPPFRSREYAMSGSDGESLYIFGGRTNITSGDEFNRIYLRDALKYNEEDGWEKIADLPVTLSNAPSSTGFIHRLGFVIFGGVTGRYTSEQALAFKDNHPGFSDDILWYRIQDNTWITQGKIPRINGPDPVNMPEKCLWPPINTVVIPLGDQFIIPVGEIRPGTRTNRILSFAYE